MNSSIQNPIKQWNQKVTEAYLGLDKASKQDQCRPFLTEISLLGPYCQCGREPDTRPVTHGASLEPPQAAYSLRLAGHLGQIVYGPFRDCLAEWCQLAIEYKKTVPWEMMPELLDIAVEKKVLKPLILTALGTRGQWLAGQNPAWKPLLETDCQDSSIWQTGLRSQRFDYLHNLRQRDPNAARELLLSTWAQESGDDRTEFLKCLAAGLSNGDEPFLEQTLGDKRKSVRDIAADLLSRIPDSAYSQRMAERVFSVIRFTPASRFIIKIGSGKFEVTIPDELDKTWLRDIPETKASGGLGVKAVQLSCMMAGVDLSQWKRWQVTPADLITAALAGEWSEAMLLGWFTAACRQQNTEWIRVFLLHMTAIEKKYSGLNYAWLIQSVPKQDRPAVLMEAVETNNLHLIELLEHTSPGWSATLSETVINAVKGYATRLNEYQLRSLMETGSKQFALLMDPKTVSSMESGWPRQSPAWTPSVGNHLDRWISVLQFRNDIHEEFLS